jgi:hypothetical protein
VARDGGEWVAFDGVDTFVFDHEPSITAVWAFWDRNARTRGRSRVWKLVQSAPAVDCDGQSGADLIHTSIAQPAEPLDENPDGHALDRVDVDRRPARHRIPFGLQQDLAR